MVYSACLRSAVGSVRESLRHLGIDVQSEEFRQHGTHSIAADAPLVLVACSGGRDSIALTAVSHIVCASLGVRCGVVIIDHALQSDSAKVASQAATRCEHMGVSPVIIRTVAVVNTGEGVEAAARNARYAAIETEAHKIQAQAILLAHTKNDQAETVLIDLLRSQGSDALAGMPRYFSIGDIPAARPLLDMTRAQTTELCHDLGLQWWDDPTNGDSGPLIDNEEIGIPFSSKTALSTQYPLRSRIRHDIIPYLSEFSGSDVVSHLAYSAKLASIDKDYLDREAQRVLQRVAQFTPENSTVRLTVSVDKLSGEHSAIRFRVLAKALAELGIPFVSKQIEGIDRLITHWHGQGPVALPSGYSATRQKHVIRLCQDSSHANR